MSEIEVILPALGFDMLRRAAGRTEGEALVRAHGPVFTFTESGTNARAKEIGGEFVVLSESAACVKEVNSIDDRTKDHRRQMLEDGILVKTADRRHYAFEREAAFSSPSAAASVIYGGRISGPATWKRESDGLSYKDWSKQRLEQAQEGMQ